MYYADYLNQRLIVLTPKVASSSLKWSIKRSSLARFLEFPTTPAEAIDHGLKPYLWAVRQPLDRVFSFNAMPYRTEHGIHESDEVFVARLLNGEYDDNNHVTLQSLWLPEGTAEHEIRFETLQSDYQRLAALFNWPELPHKNRGPGVPWQDRFNALTDAMKQGLVDRYLPDFERFGYAAPR